MSTVIVAYISPYFLSSPPPDTYPLLLSLLSVYRFSLCALALSSSLHNATFQNSNQPASFGPCLLAYQRILLLSSQRLFPKGIQAFLHRVNQIFKWLDAFCCNSASKESRLKTKESQTYTVKLNLKYGRLKFNLHLLLHFLSSSLLRYLVPFSNKPMSSNLGVVQI